MEVRIKFQPLFPKYVPPSARQGRSPSFFDVISIAYLKDSVAYFGLIAFYQLTTVA